MDELRSKEDVKCRRRKKIKAICHETGDHVHYPPTRRTKTTSPLHAPSPILESIFRVAQKTRYGECRKNQATGIGTTAYDGCGEFVSTTPGEDSANCAACGCDRSFHRDESLSDGVSKTILEVLKISSCRFRQIFCSPYGDRKTEGKKRIALDRPCGGNLVEEEEEAGRVKRVKTKFTAEQTDKMRNYAEKLQWKRSSESREEVEEFCLEIGVNRKNFMIWMNNHNEVHSGVLVKEEPGRVKRFITKFTAEQTEKMRNYAEKLRWKMSPENKEEVERFCIEIGVSRKKFMSWMNNHKEKA